MELLVTIAGCHESPCTLLLNVARFDLAVFADELRKEVRKTLDAHR